MCQKAIVTSTIKTDGTYIWTHSIYEGRLNPRDTELHRQTPFRNVLILLSEANETLSVEMFTYQLFFYIHPERQGTINGFPEWI